MVWNKKQIKQHEKAAKLLCMIKDEVFKYIKENKEELYEYDVVLFIVSKFREYGLVLDQDIPIVAFNENTRFVHYYPRKNSTKLKEGPILLDIWARLDEPRAPYADITFMGYYGKPGKEFIEAFSAVIEARDKAIDYIKDNIKNGSSGKEIDAVARDFLDKKGWKKEFKHTLGHALGIKYVHGNEKGLNKKNNERIKKNLGYTIEPGVYFDDNKFGVRSEIDFYVNDKNETIITTDLQKDIEII